MDRKKIERIITREGLIILAIIFILYCASALFFSKIDFLTFKYKMKLRDGNTTYAVINLLVKNKNVGVLEYVDLLHHPSKGLSDGLDEWLNKRNRPLWEGGELVYTKQDRIRDDFGILVSLGLLIQTMAIYFIVSSIRFISWVVRTRKEKIDQNKLTLIRIGTLVIIIGIVIGLCSYWSLCYNYFILD